MSINNGMNTQMGTKWFTFYTKIRPWFALITMFANILNFMIYTDIYVEHFGLFVGFLGYIANFILCVIAAIKANKDYNSFVRFVKVLLIFEFLFYPIASGIQTYYVNEDLAATIVCIAIFIIISYFLWYRLNIKYFRKRIITDDLYTDTYDYGAVDDNNDNRNTETTVQNVSSEKVSKNRFCRLCGSKIDSETKICSGCGKKYFKGITLNKNSVTIILLSLFLAISLFLNILQIVYINDVNFVNEYLTESVDELEGEIIVLQDELYKSQKLADFVDDYIAFVEDDGTKYYHKFDCSDFKGKSFLVYNIKAAEEKGYKPCPNCH